MIFDSTRRSLSASKSKPILRKKLSHAVLEGKRKCGGVERWVKPRDHIEISRKDFDVIPALEAFLFERGIVRQKHLHETKRTLLPWVPPRKALSWQRRRGMCDGNPL